MNEMTLIRAEVAKMTMAELMKPVVCSCCGEAIEQGLGVRTDNTDFCDMDCAV